MIFFLVKTFLEPFSGLKIFDKVVKSNGWLIHCARSLVGKLVYVFLVLGYLRSEKAVPVFL